MILSERFAFLHVSKTGGTSVARALADVLPRPVYVFATHVSRLPPGAVHVAGTNHENLRQAREGAAKVGIDLAAVPVVLAFVRNPYEMEVSLYAFLRRLASAMASPDQPLAFAGDFAAFAVGRQPPDDRPLHSYFELDGARPPNLWVGRYEHLEADLHRALAAAGIDARPTVSHTNASPHRPWRTYYTRAAEAAVHHRYHWAFAHGYYDRMATHERGRLPDVLPPENPRAADLTEIAVVPDLPGSAGASVAGDLAAHPGSALRHHDARVLRQLGVDLLRGSSPERFGRFVAWSLARTNDDLPPAARHPTVTRLVWLTPWSMSVRLLKPEVVDRLLDTDPRVRFVLPAGGPYRDLVHATAARHPARATVAAPHLPTTSR